jgi:hypothetical protein
MASAFRFSRKNDVRVFMRNRVVEDFGRLPRGAISVMLRR